MIMTSLRYKPERSSFSGIGYNSFDISNFFSEVISQHDQDNDNTILKSNQAAISPNLMNKLIVKSCAKEFSYNQKNFFANKYSKDLKKKDLGFRHRQRLKDSHEWSDFSYDMIESGNLDMVLDFAPVKNESLQKYKICVSKEKKSLITGSTACYTGDKHPSDYKKEFELQEMDSDQIFVNKVASSSLKIRSISASGISKDVANNKKVFHSKINSSKSSARTTKKPGGTNMYDKSYFNRVYNILLNLVSCYDRKV